MKSEREIDPVVLQSLQAGFEAAMPEIERKTRIFFRGMDEEKIDDRVGDVMALAWKYYRRIYETGKNPDDFIGPLATFTAKQVRAGRRLMGQQPPKDIMSEACPVRNNFFVKRLGDLTGDESALFETLTDNKRMTPADGAAFHLDYNSWRDRLPPAKRQIAEDLAAGETTNDVAKARKKSPGRISQVRKELQNDWDDFQGAGR